MIAILIVVVLAALLALRFWAADLTRMAFVPQGHFVALPPLAADAYDKPAAWIARPDLPTDPARFLPEGIARKPAGHAAVFFIHPTSLLARDHWNASVDDPDSKGRANLFVQVMASPFNAVGGIWAPRYRQAAFGSFLTDKPDSKQALDAAYRDVVLAFDAFVRQAPADAPIVLVGHSQGAVHLLHLLQQRVNGTPLSRRIVAAYIIGWPVSVRHDLPRTGLVACTAPDQTACAMSWMSFAEPADPAMLRDSFRHYPPLDGSTAREAATLCTNPLNGGSAPAAPASANLGTLVPGDDWLSRKMIARAVPARCDPATGLLLIGDAPSLGQYVLPGNNYHVYDIPLFWANVRADVERRVAAWERAR
ncbi:DUF3089 domain-containing protein [Novosphingobium sp. FKTRR1]|uniref:DUF3089 domain-containing protein n=1 Tax=Novosphingobium sp. FKTRR1 TaxID=2879118 RepID=UPI00351CBEB8